MIDIQKNISLKEYNTFGIDAKARFFVKIKNIEDIIQLSSTDIRNPNKKMILGSGANILFTGDYDGLIIKNEIDGIALVSENDNEVLVKVGAGVDRNNFINWSIDHDLGGTENMIAIPSTVGASAIGNIGAYGVEAKDIINEVEYIDLNDLTIKTLNNQECQFAYRDSIFKNELKDKAIITSIIFKLKKTNNYVLNLDYKDIQKVIQEKGLTIAKITIRHLADIISQIRNSKLPDYRKIGTAGSFFKNPIIKKEQYEGLLIKYPNLVSWDIGGGWIKISAGQLIELSGLKGHRTGNVGVSPDHALILLNYGGASGENLVNLANHIIYEVQKNFGIVLSPEVLYV